MFKLEKVNSAASLIGRRLACLLLVLTVVLTVGELNAFAVETIIDNDGPGTSYSGGLWGYSRGADPYNGTSRAEMVNGAIYEFQAEGINGENLVLIHWTWWRSRCDDVPVDIYDGDQLLDTVFLDQRDQSLAAQWNEIDTYTFTGTARVVIRAQDGCSACADAVRFSSTSPGNVAPEATDVSITGTAQVGEELTGSYTYIDADGDLEGVSTFSWLRDGAAIAGAVGESYTLVAADEGTLIVFEVTPVAQSGESPGAAAPSAAVGPVASAGGNVAPEATGVSIAGTAQVGEELTGSYTYIDADGDAEGVSTYSWLRDGAPIAGAVGESYTLVAADEGTLIVFEVTPVAQSGESPGAAAPSAAVGPVASAGGNVAPEATGVSIGGTAQVGQELTGSYTYFDADDDAEGVSTFRWLRDGAAIAGAVGDSYTLVAADEGALIVFEVTPVAQAGTSPGAAAQSAAVGPVSGLAPEVDHVTIEGADEVAENTSAQYALRVHYTNETDEVMAADSWEVSCPGLASISVAGLLTAGEVGANEPCQIEAVYNDGTTDFTDTHDIVIINAVVPVEVTVDNDGPGTSYSGGLWGYSSGADPYNGTSRAEMVNGAIYEFQADGINGENLVLIHWTWWRSRCDDVPVDIYDGDQLLDTVFLDQQDQSLAAQWNEIDTYTFTGTARAVIRAQDGCSACADAVRFSSTSPGNVAPEATDVSITGTAQVGEELTGSYTYVDADDDPEGVSTYSWLRDGAPIAGAVGESYTLVAADEGTLIVFEVTPVAQSGESPGAAAPSAAVGPVASAGGNVAPEATGVSIAGTAQVGQELTGSYTYFDADGDAEGVSTYRWLRDGAPIAGAVGESYTLVAADEGTLIVFEVTPVAQSGESPGAAAPSAAVGPVASAGGNVAPEATGVSIGGTAQVGQELTGSYTYFDADGDAEGVSTFRWLRDEAAIAGAVADSYTLVAADEGALIVFEVTPVAQSGEIPGRAGAERGGGSGIRAGAGS